MREKDIKNLETKGGISAEDYILNRGKLLMNVRQHILRKDKMYMIPRIVNGLKQKNLISDQIQRMIFTQTTNQFIDKNLLL
jgi:hypothetical protein